VTREILAAMPSALRRTLARELGLAGSDVETVLTQLASPRRIEAVLAGLPPEERDALSILLVGMGGQGARATLQAHLGRLHPAERRDAKALAALERKGLLVPAGVMPWQVAVYDVVEGPLSHAVVGWWVAGLPPCPAPTAVEPATDPTAAVADAARFLGALGHGARLTKAGDLRRADGRRLQGAFDAGRPCAIPPASPLRRDYDAPLYLLLALLLQLDLLGSVDGQLRPTAAAERWVAMRAAAQWKSLVAAWRDLAAERLGPAMPLLFTACGRGVWVDFAGALRSIVRLDPEGDWQRQQQQQFHWEPTADLFLLAGLWLGALERGNANGRTLVRLRPDAAAAMVDRTVRVPDMDEPVVVQPDFEVVVPPRAPAQVHWDLERWAERAGVDRVARYRITRASVARCSRAGESATGWLDRLQRAAKFGVPDNVRFSVAEWAETPCRADMRAVVVLTLQGEPAPGWAPPAGARHVGGAAWAIDLEDAPKALSELQARGIQVEGQPAVWREMARAARAVAGTGMAAAEFGWPCPAADEPRTPFADEPSLAEAPPPEAARRPPAPSGPAMPRREIRRVLERAERARRLVELVSLEGECCCTIVPHLDGDRVRGRCVHCGADVDLPVGRIHSVFPLRGTAG
jgi:hypothetical protein